MPVAANNFHRIIKVPNLGLCYKGEMRIVSSGVDQAGLERGAQMKQRRLWGRGRIKAKSDGIRPLSYGLATTVNKDVRTVQS